MTRPCYRAVNGYNICQYWAVDIPVCNYWDAKKTVCKFFDNPSTVNNLIDGKTSSFVKYNNECGTITVASFGEKIIIDADMSYPFCNLLGTDDTCSKYNVTTSGTVSGTVDTVSGTGGYVCSLPDINVNTCNHKTGEKWVTPLSVAEYDEKTGLLKKPISWTFDTITEYNEGTCNGAGNPINCSAYSPQHLGFGILKPDEMLDDGTFANTDKYCVTASGLATRLPLEFEMFNIRAKLSPCANWEGSTHHYTTTMVSGIGKIAWFDTKCTISGSSTGVGNYKYGTVVSGSSDVFYYKCNGASSECPRYTGICWEYCRDIKTAPGDKVLAEQIHELRYHTRQEKWTSECYKKLFDDDELYTWGGWKGEVPITLEDITLESTVVYISKFKPFEIGYRKTTLTDGIPSDDQAPNYYSLIRELNTLILDPIIKNVFEHDTVYGDYYETASLYEDKEFYIYGNTFNKSNTYIINLSDPEIKKIIPSEIYKYDSCYDLLYKTSFNKYMEVQKKLDYVLSRLMYDAPEKLRLNLTGTSSSSFICNINTYLGENIVAVFNNSDGNWGYTKTKFNKFFVGGLVVQKDFNIKGDGKAYPNMPYYERTLLLEHNDNGGIGFKFDGISHNNFTPKVSYVYNDWDYEPPPCVNYDNTTTSGVHYTGHTIYLEIFDINVINTNFQVLNNGHIIITVDNLDLTNAIMPWAPDEIVLKNKCEYIDDKGNKKEIIEEVELEIIVHGASGMLLPNQIICYPKDIEGDDKKENTAPCNNSIIQLKGVWNFHKRSFGEKVKIKTDIYTDDKGNKILTGRKIAILAYENQAVASSAEIKYTEGKDGALVLSELITIRKFQTTQIIGVAFTGRSGRVIGTTQTKMLTWIKQPYCPDVEIFYKWKKTYDVFKNNPICSCHGKWSSNPEKVYPPHTEDQIPFCGDHNLYSDFSWFDSWIGYPSVGPMWWPYNSCRGFQTYTVINNQDYSALEIMNDFTKTDDNGNYLHGQHDLRMLGPSMCTAWQGDFVMWCHSACPCGRETFNAKGKGEDNTFIGYGQIRSGVSSTQLTKWRVGTPGFNKGPEDLPKFGNASRPFLRSYRSSDIIHYYHYVNMGEWVDIRRRTKWLPTIMNFTDVDITSTESQMFKQYDSPYKQCNTLDSLGFMKAGKIDNINVDEKLLDVRLRFNDVFQTRGNNDISYPSVNMEYAIGVIPGTNTSGIIGPESAVLRLTMPWLEFKYHDNGLIQWAWRDYWKPLERRYKHDLYKSVHGEYKTKAFNSGMFLCLAIDYPEYKYDLILKEGMPQPDEGEHVITFIPADEDEIELGIFGKFKLDDGPERTFNFNGDWDVGDDSYGNNKLYKETIGHPWYNDIGLFTNDYFDITVEGATYDNVPEDQTVIVSAEVDSYGVFTKEITYFQRGLNTELIPGFFWMLPKEFFDAEIINSKITSSNELLDEITFEIRYNTVGEDGKSKPIGRVVLSYYFGEYVVPINNVAEDAETVLFHDPEIDIYIKRGNGYYKVYNKPGMRLAKTGIGRYTTVTRVCNLSLPTWALEEHPDTLYIVYRGAPTQWETNHIGGMGVYNEQDNHIFLTDIKAYIFDFIEGIENIYTHERRYHVSVGKYGDMAPQGPDNRSAKSFSEYTDGLASSDTVYALGAIEDEFSTVWQQDSRTGILDNLNRSDIIYGGSSIKTKNNNKIDIPSTNGPMSCVNKCRGRHMKDIVPELEPLLGDPKVMEKKQKEMFSLIYDAGFNTKSMKMSLLVHNSLRKYFNDNGMYIGVYGDCSFYNSYVSPIPGMIPLDSYSPMGHLYVQSKYYSSTCGNESFYWEYVQQEPLESTSEMKKNVTNEDINQDFLDTIIGHDVELQHGINSKRGVGSVYITEESREALGGTYLRIINEVTKYSLGTILINERLDIMAYLVNVIYPYYYSRATGLSVFIEEEFSELVYPPPLQDYPFSYFPSDYSGYSENANIERDKFYLYGGWNDHFLGPEEVEGAQAFLDLLGGRYSFG